MQPNGRVHDDTFTDGNLEKERTRGESWGNDANGPLLHFRTWFGVTVHAVVNGGGRRLERNVHTTFTFGFLMMNKPPHLAHHSVWKLVAERQTGQCLRTCNWQ